MSTFPKRLIEELGDSPSRRLLEASLEDEPSASRINAVVGAASAAAAARDASRRSSHRAGSIASSKIVLFVVPLVIGAIAFGVHSRSSNGRADSQVSSPEATQLVAIPPVVATEQARRTVPNGSDFAATTNDAIPVTPAADLPNAPPPTSARALPAAIPATTAARAESLVPTAGTATEPLQDILREANHLRAVARWSEAAAMYQRVLDRGPRSPEAYPADVALGNLHLQQSRPSEALAHYEHALATEPAGVLAEEARWGKARAFRALGRTPDERAALEEFRARHPESPLLPAVVRRLAEIGS